MKTARLTSLPPSGGLQFYRLLKNVLAIGLVAASMQLHAAGTAYQYDARGRLIQVTQGTGENEKEHNYVYDDAGNRTQVNTGHPPGMPGIPEYWDASIDAANTIRWAAAPLNKADSVLYRLQKKLRNDVWTDAIDDSDNMTGATSVSVTLEDGYYQFRVKACNGARPKACSDYATSSLELEVRVQPEPPILNAPDGDTTVVLGSAVRFGWASGGGTVSSYRLQRATTENQWSYYEELGNVTGKMVLLDVEHGYDFGEYWFRVIACNIRWSCNPGSTVKITVAPPAPSAPGVGSDSDHDGTFTVSWSSSYGASGYHLYERTNGNWSATPITSTSTSLSRTRNDGNYAYRVRACTSGACSPYSGTSAEIAIVNKPGTPGSISYPSQDTNGAFTVSWSAASAAGASSVKYQLQYQKNNGSWTNYGGLTTSTSAAISGFGNGNYEFRVKACNGVSTGTCSAYRTSSQVTEVRHTPSVPQNLSSPRTVVAGTHSNIPVTWDASSGTVTHYNLQKSDSGSYSTIYTGLDRTQAVPAGIVAGNSYSFRVRACNDWACSSYSNTTFTRTTTGGYCIPSPCPPPNVVDPGEPVEAGIEEQRTMGKARSEGIVLTDVLSSGPNVVSASTNHALMTYSYVDYSPGTGQ